MCVCVHRQFGKFKLLMRITWGKVKLRLSVGECVTCPGLVFQFLRLLFADVIDTTWDAAALQILFFFFSILLFVFLLFIS